MPRMLTVVFIRMSSKESINIDSIVEGADHSIRLRYPFIERQKEAYPITVLCQVMETSRSGYYGYTARERKGSETSLGVSSESDP